MSIGKIVPNWNIIGPRNDWFDFGNTTSVGVLELIEGASGTLAAQIVQGYTLYDVKLERGQYFHLLLTA